MHPGNRRWLSVLKTALPAYFHGAAVLELGAQDVNGSAREYFVQSRRYVGIDRCPGRGVDQVVEARETRFDEPGWADTLVCLSVFEHDPDWEPGFVHNLQWVRPGGLIIVGWGAEGNLRHGPEPWAPVPAGRVLEALQKWPVHLLDAFFEESRFGKDTPGAFDLLALKK